MEVTFYLTPCDETGGYVARWDDPTRGGITTQGDSLAELDEMVRDAVDGYFADRPLLDLKLAITR
jgi:predicted RNase H-like HicB family nuclease